MANITLLNRNLQTNIDISKWIEENTILQHFLVQKQITTLNTCKLLLWIASRCTSNKFLLSIDYITTDLV